MTHSDKLNELKSDDYKSRLNATINASSEPRFAIIGNHKGTFEEEIELLRNYASIKSRHEIQQGTFNLNKYIEHKISDHLDSQLPIATNSI